MDRYTEAFKHVASLVGNPDRTGVYCTIADRDGFVMVTFAIARPQPLNAERYYSLAYEKAFRLGRNHHHLTSGQSADEHRNQYPGAYRTRPYDNSDGKIISISGLPTGSADLATGLLAPWSLGEVDLDYADMIAELDGENPYWEQLRKNFVR